MAKAYITTNAETQVATGYCRKVLVQVNAALTGTIKVLDNTTGNTANVATITNPTVGSKYEYWDFTAGCRVVASTTCDVTVSVDQNSGAK